MTNKTFAGEQNTPSTFHLALSEDDAARARFDAVCGIITTHAAELGFKLGRSDIEAMPSARLAALTDTELSGEIYERELRALPQYKAAMKEKELAEKVKAGGDEAAQELASMSPARRMSHARRNGLTGESSPEDSEAIKEAKRAIMMTLQGAARIAYGRANGLI